MSTVITNKDNVVMGIGSIFSENASEPGVVFLDGAGYGLFGQKVFQNVEVPAGVVPNIYTYDGITFSNYVSEIDRIKQDAIDEYTLELMQGGVL